MSRAGGVQRATRRKSGGGFLLGMFVGLLVGLGFALGVAFYLNKTPLPFSSKAPTPAKNGATAGVKPRAIAGMPSSPASEDAAFEKPRFDFYKILPGGEETLSEKELKERLRIAKSKPEAGKGVYFVQAGSFQNPADADNQKARLAILGFESSVEPAALPDKGTWYRVRIGPYTGLDDVQRVRQTLVQSGIDASLVKLKTPSEGKAN